MNRRTLKKQIPQLSQRLITPTHKYLAATARVHPDIIFSYEREIEFGVFELMRVYLILDPSWPHRERWLDGLSEEFTWERQSGILYGSGELFWGHWPEVGRKITGLPFTTELKVCSRHGVDYLFRYRDSENVRRYSSQRWCLQR